MPNNDYIFSQKYGSYFFLNAGKKHINSSKFVSALIDMYNQYMVVQDSYEKIMEEINCDELALKITHIHFIGIDNNSSQTISKGMTEVRKIYIVQFNFSGSQNISCYWFSLHLSFCIRSKNCYQIRMRERKIEQKTEKNAWLIPKKIDVNPFRTGL